MAKPCNTCPFLKDSKNIGDRSWLIDVLRILYQGSLSHSCHKTDPMADGYVAGKSRQCEGIRQVAVNDKLGVPLYRKVFRSWMDFFTHHKDRQDPADVKKIYGTCPSCGMTNPVVYSEWDKDIAHITCRCGVSATVDPRKYESGTP